MSLSHIRFPVRDKHGRFSQVEAFKFKPMNESRPMFVAFGLFICVILAAYIVKIW